MAELPGWDRTRLATAAEADVSAARWMAYARVLAPEITVDYAAKIREFQLADMEPKAAARNQKAWRQEKVTQLKIAQGRQADYRKQLLLDEPDEEPADDA